MILLLYYTATDTPENERIPGLYAGVLDGMFTVSLLTVAHYTFL